MRSPLLHSIVAALPFALSVACGGATRTSSAPGEASVPSAVSGSPSATASSASPRIGTQPSDGAMERQRCARLCAPQTACGTAEQSCMERCLPIAVILEPEVFEQEVKCVEGTAPKGCGADDRKVFRETVARCMLEAAAVKDDEGRANVDAFAQSFCEATARCGSDGVFRKDECLGRARGAIRATGSATLYGAMRVEKVGELRACLGAPCSERMASADDEVGRCLQRTLEHAAGK